MSTTLGQRSRLLRLYKRAPGVDALNRPNGPWEPYRQLWVQPKGSTGMGTVRAAEGGLVGDVARHSFRAAYTPQGLDIGLQARYRERLPDGSFQETFMDVQAIRHDLERREWTDIVCASGGNDG